MLEAVPGPSAERATTSGRSRMTPEDEVGVVGQLVLTDARADDRRVGKRRETPRRVVARDLLEGSREGSRSSVSGSTSSPATSGAIFVPRPPISPWP